MKKIPYSPELFALVGTRDLYLVWNKKEPRAVVDSYKDLLEEYRIVKLDKKSITYEIPSAGEGITDLGVVQENGEVHWPNDPTYNDRWRVEYRVKGDVA
jgi:hypothetical protein